jgi:hypothetical protein
MEIDQMQFKTSEGLVTVALIQPVQIGGLTFSELNPSEDFNANVNTHGINVQQEDTKLFVPFSNIKAIHQ